MRSHLALALLAPLLAAPAAARPITVWLNDVRLEGTDGLRGQTFTNVDVRFDEAGDLRIVAKGYKISQSQPATPTGPATASAGAHRFWIASMQPRQGAAQWDIDVYINQTFIKKFRSKDAEPIFEITRFLKPGTNTIHYKARKADGERVSASPTDYLELVVGDGEMRAGQVMLNRITSYRRTAAESGSFDNEATLELASQ
jgi:hypothetical protein